MGHRQRPLLLLVPLAMLVPLSPIAAAGGRYQRNLAQRRQNQPNRQGNRNQNQAGNKNQNKPKNAAPKKPTKGDGSASIYTALERVVRVQGWQGQQWLLGDRTADSLGQELAVLKPSLVSGLIRLQAGDTLSDDEVAAYQSIRRTAQAAHRECWFDVVLDAGHATSETALVDQMKDINAKLKPNIWLVTGLDPAVAAPAGLARAAITYAHSLQQPIGLDLVGTTVLEQADFLTIADGWGPDRLKGQIDFVRERSALPRLVYLPDGALQPGQQFSATTFAHDWTPAQRVDYVTQAATNQEPWAYHLAYPLVYVPAGGVVYDAAQDPTVLAADQHSMAQFNPVKEDPAPAATAAATAATGQPAAK